MANRNVDNILQGMGQLDKLKMLQTLREDLGGTSRFDNDEFMEVSLLWLKGEITVTVIRDLIGNNNYASCVAIGLRRAFKQGRLVEPKEVSNADA
jgi:hypothetical protein